MAIRRFDLHNHMMPPAYLAEVKDKVVGTAGGFLHVLEWSPERLIGELETSGFHGAALSIATPGVYFGDAEQARRLARVCNDYGAELKRDHPGRFAILAALPLPDVDACLAEIAYLYDTLKLDGVGLLSSYGDTWLGDASLDPVFAELNRRKAVVYVHPTTPDACRGIVRGLPDPLLEFLFDSTRAMVNLLYSGTLARYPDIRFFFTHGAAALPSVYHRITHALGIMKQFQPKIPDGVPATLARLYFDVANTGHPVNLDALKKITSPDHILYGSDFPFVPVNDTLGQLRAAGYTEADLDRIAGTNAVALFPTLAG